MHVYENWAPMFSVTVGAYLMSLDELKQLKREVVQNSTKGVTIDKRFGLAKPYLESAIKRIDYCRMESERTGDRECSLLLNFGECFAIYQVLKDTKSKWRMFIFGWAFEIFVKMINRGLFTVYESLNKKDAKSFIDGMAWYRLESSVCELELVAKKGRPDGYLDEMKKRKPRI